MLAFKNDIGFWKDKKNVQGLSVSGWSGRRSSALLPLPPQPRSGHSQHALLYALGLDY